MTIKMSRALCASTALATGLLLSGHALAQSTGTAIVEELVVTGNTGPKNLDGAIVAIEEPKSRASITQEFISRQAPGGTILDATLFQHLPRGASLVHVGRGAHLDHPALLDALETGWLSGAVVDVTDPEPLPEAHPFWAHPKILLTPHIASMTQPETAVAQVLDNIRRHQAGAPLIGLVDRSRGY